MTEAEIKRGLLLAWEYAYVHEEWVEPLDALLEGLPAEAAFAYPISGSPSIAEIVVHLAVFNENIVDRIRSGEKISAEVAWPPAGDWRTDQARLRASIAAVRETIEETPLDAIQAAGYGLADLLCRFVHLGYHLGQIEKLRALIVSSSSA